MSVTFTRTPSGLSALHAFLGVDAVVFVEGGEVTYNVSQILAGGHNQEAIDIPFWAQVFGHFMPGVKFHFRAIGGKDAVREIGKMIANGSVSRVFATTDRDFDHILLNGKPYYACLRSFGYSWENDVCTPENGIESFYGLCCVDRHAVDIQEEFKEIIREFFAHMKRYVYTDFLYAASGTHLISRESPAGFLAEIKANMRPSPNVRRMRAIIKGHSGDRGRFTPLVARHTALRDINPSNDCCGHFVIEVYYRTVAHLLNKHTRAPKIPKDVFLLGMIARFRNSLHHLAGCVADHYKAEFSRARELAETWGMVAPS